MPAKRYLISGRVQGVGYRAFAQRAAAALGVKGYARNLSDGSVEVYASGGRAELDAFAGHLRKGPRWSDVRAVQESEAPVVKYESFRIEA